jgi:pentapeptide MXKDX repeat protein
MTIRNRLALAAAIFAFSLAVTLAPAAFAEDPAKTDAMSHGTKAKAPMGKDSMSKDSMSKDAMGKDSMKKDETAE